MQAIATILETAANSARWMRSKRYGFIAFTLPAIKERAAEIKKDPKAIFKKSPDKKHWL